jgi:ribosomal protein S18 acetylase RimI-like enzyme
MEMLLEMSQKVNMEIEPRPFHDETDLEKMRDLLQAGRRAKNGTYYIHIGDLNWWLFYPAWEYDPWQHVYLWDDSADPVHLLGWALFSPRWGSYDVYVQPELRGTAQAESMYSWAEGKLAGLRRADGQIGAFCIVWPDPLNKVGLFEPVGTHPDFKRRGLGKAVMSEALHRLQERGMVEACVCTNANNTPAVKLYESVGFRTVDIHLTYKKDL